MRQSIVVWMLMLVFLPGCRDAGDGSGWDGAVERSDVVTGELEGWAVGRNYNTTMPGVLLHFVDGAWSQVPVADAPANWLLTGVSFVDAAHGWAVGSWIDGNEPEYRGLVLRYAGDEWAQDELPARDGRWYLTDVHFTDAAHGWAVGYDTTEGVGVVLRFADGAWREEEVEPFDGSWLLKGVAMTSAGAGRAVGFSYDEAGAKDSLALVYDGETWTRDTDVPPMRTLEDIAVGAADEYWAIGFMGSGQTRLLHHAGGGWESTTWPDASAYGSYGGTVASIALRGAGTGWATNGSADAALSFDGAQWQEVSLLSHTQKWGIRATCALPGGGAWVAGAAYRPADEPDSEGLPYDIGEGLLLHYDPAGGWTRQEAPTWAGQANTWDVADLACFTH